MYSQYNNTDDTLSGHIIFSYYMYLFMSIDWMLKKWGKNEHKLYTGKHKLSYNISAFIA